MTAGDEAAVIAANQAFYEAFEALDIDRMASCWQQDEHVRCIHPGWDVMVGWPQVSRSLMAIFANSGYIQFFLTDVQVQVDHELGWVTCAENILSGSQAKEEMEGAKVLATNVFRRVDGTWRMVHHHGSPVLPP